MDRYNLAAGLLGGVQRGIESYNQRRGLLEEREAAQLARKQDQEFRKSEREADQEFQLKLAALKDKGSLETLQRQKLLGEIEEQKNKEKEKQEKRGLLEQQAKAQANIVAGDIDTILSKVDKGEFRPGLQAAIAGRIPGTQSYDVNTLLDGIKGNIAFDKLQQMRAASPTGGALGSVSDQEMKLLQSVLGQLNPGSSKEQFVANLERIRELQDRIINKGMTPEEVAEYRKKLAQKPQRGLLNTAEAESGRSIAKRLYSPSRNQTKIIYSDGSEEVVDGKK